ncbi:DUF2157 domain-containing protein [Anatilimnocola sp. NA78]|uniref:DUF2157 domain-containing protein n=1 Tax=Anatilimnocola sp. NA78 TaxID=3415683 RepID=UPI003CE5C07D
MSERRPIPLETRQWLIGELEFWQQEKVLRPEQLPQILNLYETSASEQDSRHNWFVIVLCSLAALLLAAAVMLLVGFNWDQIPPAGKLAIIFGVLIGTYSVAFGIWRWGNKRLAETVFFLAAIFYGAAIWLIAQVFHMSAHYPDGFFWWALGVLPLAILLDTLLLHALFAVLLGTWIGSEVIGYGHLGALLFGVRWNWISNGAYLAPLMALPGMWLAYQRRSVATLAIYLPLLVWWICLQPIGWRWHDEMAYFVGAVGAMLLILGESHFAGSKFAIPYRMLGVLLFGSALLPLSYHRYYDWWRYEQTHGLLTAIVIASLTGLAMAAAEYVRFRCLEAGQLKEADRFAEIRQRQWLPLSLAAVMAGLALIPVMEGGGNFRNADPLVSITSALIANAAMIALSIWLMWIGVRDDRGQPFFAGVGYFLLWMMLRYSDLFGFEAGMLGAAALFGACGVAIGGLAWFWQRRKQVVHV